MRISSAGKGRCAGEKLKRRRQILGRPSQAQFQRHLLRRSSEQAHRVTSSSFVAIDLTRRSVNVRREQFEMGNVASLVPDEHPSCIRVAGQQPPIPVGTAVNLSRPKRPRRNLLPVPPNGRSATPAVKGRRFKLRYYRNLLLPPARPSGSNADALPMATPITSSPGPAEPANQPGLDWIAADPERSGWPRSPTPLRPQKARSGRYDSGHLLSHLLCPFFDIEWGGVRLRIGQPQDPALLFRCLT